MTNKYCIRYELTDNTLEEPMRYFSTKTEALRWAKKMAKLPSFDAVRLWVENVHQDTGIQSFTLPPYQF